MFEVLLSFCLHGIRVRFHDGGNTSAGQLIVNSDPKIENLPSGLLAGGL